MKSLLVFLLSVHIALAQTETAGSAGISGTVVDGKTLKPVPAALVIASRAGAPSFTRNTKSGADGAYQIQGLTPGNYLVCVQASGDQYLNPCEWNGSPSGITLISGQAATGIKIAITPASALNVQVDDAQEALSQLTKNGRRPDLSVGVWGPTGMYYPARAVSSPTTTAVPQASISTYRYQLAVPRDTALNFYIASHDLKLGDANGVALPANASQQAFQHATGDANPKSFTFTVLGKLP
ncbi:MAG TPA: carboxypeptidase-like regulatory domain-containing protein [Bryobacteraceae bacterium]|nr:carboxypeptidase-like regulatory domain-containing protein [Bryobacteraceae bacterium]